MKKKGYIVRLVVFTLLAAVGIFTTIAGLAALRDYHDRRSYEAISLVVDFSMRGEYRGIFKQKFIPEHGQQLRLIVEPPFGTTEEIAVALRGLRGHFEIRRPDGNIARREEVVPENFVELYKGSVIREKNVALPESPDEAYKLGFGGCCGYEAMPAYTPFLFYDFAGLRFDSYDFVFSVDEPADGMKGRSQTLVSKNVYCRTVWGFLQALGVMMVIVGCLFLVGAVFLGKNIMKTLRGKNLLL